MISWLVARARKLGTTPHSGYSTHSKSTRVEMEPAIMPQWISASPHELRFTDDTKL